MNRQAEQLVEDTTGDATNRIVFQFQSSERSTLDPNRIRQDLNMAASDYVEGGNLPRAASNTSATMINDARKAVFFDDDVVETIASFTFVNFDPKSAICQKLAGKSFLPDDAEFMQYEPPLHHNCKSYLRANLKPSNVDVTGLPTITQTERDSITFKEPKE